MALTQEEKEYVIEVLDQMDRQKVARILSSTYSFMDWLKGVCQWFFDKIATWELSHLFDKLHKLLF